MEKKYGLEPTDALSIFLIVSEVLYFEVLFQCSIEVEIGSSRVQTECWMGKTFPTVFSDVVIDSILACRGHSFFFSLQDHRARMNEYHNFTTL
jgi:hypothetical protein